jgi:hypothetical protein
VEGEPGREWRWRYMHRLADVEKIARERMLRPSEAAYMLGIDPDHLHALMLAGEIPAYRTTLHQGHARYRLEDVVAYARSRPRARTYAHHRNGGRSK